MSYDPTWANGNGAGRVVAAVHRVKLSDPTEIAAAINRRRLTIYEAEQDFSSDVDSGKAVRQHTIASGGCSAGDLGNAGVGGARVCARAHHGARGVKGRGAPSATAAIATTTPRRSGGCLDLT